MVLALMLLTLITPMQPLSSYVNHKRVLLVFGTAPHDSRVDRQLLLLNEHTAELQERDVVVLQDLIGAHDRDPDATRARFNVTPTEFTVILIGKDGGEKLRQHTPITIERLVNVIDAMPMRKDEMRRKK